MSTRFTDDLFHNTEGSDFIVRNRRPLAIRLFLAFAIAFIAIYTAASLMSAMNTMGSKGIFFLILTLTIGVLGWVTMISASQHRDLVLATEFQNAMLASAVQLSTRFCLITKRDGSIVYIDPGFQKLFPQFMHGDGRTIDGLFTSAGILPDVIKKISTALERYQAERVMMPFKDAAGNITPMIITIDVLPRPKGYFLFRGRDFIEKRTAPKSDADTTSALLLEQALYVLPEGVLITNSAGLVTYVNHALEEWLGYTTGEMLIVPLTIERICHQYAGVAIGQPVLDNFNGEILLRSKNGTIVTMYIRQKLLRDKDQVLGLSAIISPAESAKKN